MSLAKRSLGLLLSSLAIFWHPAAGQKCWRNTTCSTITETAFPGPWESNIYAPASRTVVPKSVLSAKGQPELLGSSPGPLSLPGNGSQLVFDFGIEVGGIVTVKYSVGGQGAGAIGLAFSEAKNWIGEWSDSSNGGFRGPDGAIYANFTGPGKASYTMPDEKLRGGFRYLTLFLVSRHATVDIESVSLEIAFQPTWPKLRAYQGYFHCSDALLNAIWYAGAYTLQTNAVPSTAGRRSPFVRTGWANDGAIGTADTVIVDGAKRDRAVWPGDMGVAVPSAFVSTGDLASMRNALQTVYDYMNKDGSFPEAGPPLLQQGSDTYHMWTMIGTYNYVLYTNDTVFLERNWAKYLRAMEYITAKQAFYPSGLLRVTGTRDWARWQTGTNMSEAQMILYRTLTTGAELASWMSAAHSSSSSSSPPSSLSAKWTAAAATLQSAITTHCYDPPAGAFRDNATSTTLHPQDANALALLFGVVPPLSRPGQAISQSLTRNWTPLGPEPPELPGNISPFISSFEVAAHLAAGQPARALELVRRLWGWYAAHPNGTGSTVVEGFRTDGSWGYRQERGYGGDPSYVSHAHGWSSGPTGALTEGVLGLVVVGRMGETWRFAPQFGDLSSAEGGFVTGLGRFAAGWVVEEGRGREGREGRYRTWVDVPAGTKGTVVLPVLLEGVMPTVMVDGKEMETKWERRSDVAGVVSTVMFEIQGGKYSIVVT